MFKDVPNFYTSAPDYTFEVKLFETSSIIEVHIVQSTTDDDSPMTVGIENQSGTDGVQSFRGTGSLSNVAFRYGNIVPLRPPVR